MKKLFENVGGNQFKTIKESAWTQTNDPSGIKRVEISPEENDEIKRLIPKYKHLFTHGGNLTSHEEALFSAAFSLGYKAGRS